jgi:hypothetical protein
MKKNKILTTRTTKEVYDFVEDRAKKRETDKSNYLHDLFVKLGKIESEAYAKGLGAVDYDKVAEMVLEVL